MPRHPAPELEITAARTAFRYPFKRLFAALTGMLEKMVSEALVFDDENFTHTPQGNIVISAFEQTLLKGSANILVMPNMEAARISYNLLRVSSSEGVTVADGRGETGSRVNADRIGASYRQRWPWLKRKPINRSLSTSFLCLLSFAKNQ